MNARKRGPAWPKIAVGLAAIALLLVVLVFMGRMLLGALNLLHTDGGPAQPDPQFAEPAETFAPPPELMESPDAPAQDVDPSSRWVEENQTPVDMTADQLAAEDYEPGEADEPAEDYESTEPDEPAAPTEAPAQP